MCHVCRTWMSHVIHMNRPPVKTASQEGIRCGMMTRKGSVMSHMWLSHVRQLRMSHVTRMQESCHTYECIIGKDVFSRGISCTMISHVTHMNESYHTYEWVIPRIWRSQVIRMIASPWKAASQEGISCTMFSHVTHMNESCHTCEWVMPLVWRSYVTHMAGVFPRKDKLRHNESCHTNMNKSRHTCECVMSVN